MSTSAVADMPDIDRSLNEAIACPLCNGRGQFSRMEVLESLGIKDDGLTDQIWSLEELVELLGSKRRRRQPEELMDHMGHCR